MLEEDWPLLRGDLQGRPVDPPLEQKASPYRQGLGDETAGVQRPRPCKLLVADAAEAGEAGGVGPRRRRKLELAALLLGPRGRPGSGGEVAPPGACGQVADVAHRACDVLEPVSDRALLQQVVQGAHQPRRTAPSGSRLRGRLIPGFAGVTRHQDDPVFGDAEASQ